MVLSNIVWQFPDTQQYWYHHIGTRDCSHHIKMYCKYEIQNTKTRNLRMDLIKPDWVCVTVSILSLNVKTYG